MTKSLRKRIVILFMPAVFAGILLLFCGFTAKLPKNTYVENVSVGGLSRRAAVEKVRERLTDRLKQKELVICADECVYTYAYPEIGFRDDAAEVIGSIAKSGSYGLNVRYFLNGEDVIVSAICADVDTEMREPRAYFTGGGPPFLYSEGNDGKSCDRRKLKEDIGRSLGGGFEKVVARMTEVKRKRSLGDVKEETKLLASFSTEYDADNASRSHNIALACKKINGTVIAAGGEFSFNGAVGARTEKNGFRKAKIIEGGRFVDGFGGGVCQVSTTLYNAALLSGCSVTEFHPHSLQVSYVPASRDAMVSGTYFDMKFKNPFSRPVFLCATADKGTLTCKIYGKGDGAVYSLSSEVLETLPPPPAEEAESSQEGFIVAERSGVKSCGYLTVTRGGVTTTVRIRSDTYAAVRGVKGVKRREEDGGQSAAP